jgi:hypothetical protein
MAGVSLECQVFRAGTPRQRSRKQLIQKIINRLMVMTRDPVTDYRTLDLLKTVARAKPAKVRLVAKPDDHGDWDVKSTRAA